MDTALEVLFRPHVILRTSVRSASGDGGGTELPNLSVIGELLSLRHTHRPAGYYSRSAAVRRRRTAAALLRQATWRRSGRMDREIGRASCRERGEVSGGGGR